MTNLIEIGLNPQQKEAIFYNEGPLLVIAGPGSGKTTVLTKRIARILTETKGDKFKILALTFTTKAAGEMKERVERLVGEDIHRLNISTFHGFCFDVLRKYGNYIGLSNEFTIYEDSKDYEQVLIEAVQEELQKSDSHYNSLLFKFADESVLRKFAPQYLAAITRLKNKLIAPNDIPANSMKFDVPFRICYSLYNEKLRKNTAIDYGDLLFFTCKLFKEKPFIAKQYRSAFKHLLIDEAQDTNKAQFELVRSFCGEKYSNIFIVADEDQLIYEWNDARFEYLLKFVDEKKAKILQMFENYRCPTAILQMANQLIKLNMNRLNSKKDLNANNHYSEEAVFLKNYNLPEEESINVVKEIKSINDFNNTCIIARNHRVLSLFEDCLKKAQIPFYYPSTTERFVSKEAKILLSLLQCAFNEEDKVHISKVCDYFSINMEDLLNLENQTLFFRFLGSLPEEYSNLSNIVGKLLNSKLYFLDYIDPLFKELTGVDPHIDENLENDENKSILDDYKQLKTIIKQYNRDRDEEERNIGDFLSYLALAPKGGQKLEGVTLLTGHAAKGLEYDYVFIVSLNQGVFPDFRAEKNERSLEEERRNFFVAITRTRKKLFLSYTNCRSTKYGYMSQTPSQFLYEIGLL